MTFEAVSSHSIISCSKSLNKYVYRTLKLRFTTHYKLQRSCNSVTYIINFYFYAISSLSYLFTLLTSITANKYKINNTATHSNRYPATNFFGPHDIYKVIINMHRCTATLTTYISWLMCCSKRVIYRITV